MASADALEGERIGGYTLLFRAGKGGMGEVFVAERRGGGGFRKIVALKRLLPAYADAAPFLDSMREEARLAAMVRHGNVCPVIELIEDAEAGPVLVMEYLDGVPLRRLASATCDVALATALFAQACDGVEAIHRLADDDGRPMGIVHRDINPSNMIVSPDGTLRILDFGIARAEDAPARTRTGEIKGTTPYLSPEQVLAQRVDQRADVFALGVTLFELLSGVSPYRRENEFLTQRAITSEEPPALAALRPDVPAALAQVVTRAMERDPAARFASAAELGRSAVAAVAPAPLPERRTIGEVVATRFSLELEERRRRIARAVEVVDALAPVAEPVTTPLVAPRPAVEPRARVTAARGAWRWGVLAAALAAGAALAGWVALDRAPPAERAAAAPLPVDAAPAPTAAAPAVAAPDAAPLLAPPARRAPPPRRKGRRRSSTAAGPPGYLTIASRPFATIFVDGRRLGVTPIYRVEVASGKRRIRADCSCGKTRSFTIDIAPGVAAPPRTLTW